MNNDEIYDVAVVGGGLAGLSCAILLAKRNYRVILFEKETYPFHKVCGEYISLESYDLLISLGLPLNDQQLPLIKKLYLSSPSGTLLQQQLPLGGFGITRYSIDEQLATVARNNGVVVSDNSRVDDIVYMNNEFAVSYNNQTARSKVVCGAFGKRSNIDVKWKRSFVQRKPNALNNFIGIKYHALLDHPRDRIDLHNFKNGYCGISPVENDKTCICYLTTAQNLKDSGNNIQVMEQETLVKNPFLKEALANAKMLYEKPLAISQISFDKKEQVENHILLLGDAAGMIAPLCGNGMSMALHSSTIASELIGQFLSGKLSRGAMENEYKARWNNAFSSRLKAGRIIQALFASKWLVNASIGVLRHFPGIVTRIIRQTHG